MKTKLTAIFIFIFLSVQSQDLSKQLEGDWIKYKMEMKDGSKLKSSIYREDTFLKFCFTKKSFISKSDPLDLRTNNSEINFDLKGNVIKTSELSGYLIEGLSGDTLIIADNYKSSDDKLIRYFFVKDKKMLEYEQSKQSGDTFVANINCTPKLTKAIDLNSLSREYFNISGRLKLDLVNKSVETIVTDSNANPEFVDELTEALSKTYRNWDTSDFGQYQFIEVPFLAYGQKLDKKVIAGGRIAADRIAKISFLQTPFDLMADYGNKTKSMKLYWDGLIALKNSDTDTAIVKFTEAYESDGSNYEALYSRAALYQYKDQKEKACDDWKFLADLGQIRGINSLNQYCKQ